VDVPIRDRSQSRTSLLHNCVVLVMAEVDYQYFHLLKCCGAIVFTMYNTEGVAAYQSYLKENGLDDVTKDLSQQLELSSVEVTICRFHDDCRPPASVDEVFYPIMHLNDEI
jgi:hypothetical protein